MVVHQSLNAIRGSSVVQVPLSTDHSSKADSAGESEQTVQEWLHNVIRQIVPRERLSREQALTLSTIEGQENFVPDGASADGVSLALALRKLKTTK